MCKLGRIATALVTAACLTATATDYYVSTEGTDSNDGLTLETALATVAKANAKAGKDGSNRILIAPGEYESATTNGDMFEGPTVLGLGAKPTDVVLKHSGSYRPVKVSAGEVRNLTICGGASTSSGGCVYMTGGLIDNCVLMNGVATSKGGNLWMSGGKVTNTLIVGGTCTSNNDQSGGGNVWVEGTATIVDCDIRGGVATAGRGGNMTCYGSDVGDILVSHCRFEDGQAATDGGNLCLTRAATVTDCTFTGGSSTSDNWARGGGNVASLGNCLVSRCVMTGGHAQGNKGGGIRARAEGSVYEDCLIASNPEGGVYLESGAQLYNCTIVKNIGNGVWILKNSGGKLVNCVVYGNRLSADGDSKDWAGDTLTADRVVTCALGSSNWDGQVVLTDDKAFADYANGDYTPTPGGALDDAGSEDPRGASASSLDLAGKTRVCKTIDIGAYELQKTAFTFGFVRTSAEQGLAPQKATFVNQVSDASGSVTFAYDFGDGTKETYVDVEEVFHDYANPGSYTVTVTATDAAGQSSTVTHAAFVRLVAKDLFVVAGNPDAAYPYDSFANAAATVGAAVEAAQPGCTVTVSNGLYEVSSQIVVNKGITVRGLTGDPEDVIVRNTHAISGDCEFRAFKVESADALVTGVAMENGASRNRLGGGLFVSAGCVSNCVIRNCSLQSSYYGCGAGVRLDGANARLTHCVVTNNVLSGSSTEWYRCAGVSLKGGASAENCLIAYNRATGATDSDTPSSIVGGVLMESAGDRLINCTIVSNVVEYPVTSAWAGLRPSWHGTVQNCVIAENYNLNPQVEQVGEDGTKTYVPVEGPQLASVAGYTDSYVGNCVTDQPTATDKFTVAASGTLFRDFASGDLEPALGGPLYDAGLAVTGQPAVDLAGNPRVHGSRIDIGCYESPRSKGFMLIVR